MTTVAKVAFQGEPGAFSEEAVIAYFGQDLAADAGVRSGPHGAPVANAAVAGAAAVSNRLAVPTWRAVFESVRDGDVEAGVVAIESSLAGSIRETYDLLAEFYDSGVRIVGEVSVPVRLALVALPGQSLDWIERVYSHAQALAQADEFLRTRDWQVMTTYNTAGAARMIAENRERHAAAVASPRVAELYGLEVLAADIQTGADNRTRFAVIARDGFAGGPPAATPGPRKSTLVFAVRNVPGSLNRCLGAFASRGVNLSRLESRPARTARWEYVFWVDIDADAEEPACSAALAELRTEAEMVRVLGSYPRTGED